MLFVSFSFTESLLDQEFLCLVEVLTDNEILGVVCEWAQFPEGQREFRRLPRWSAPEKRVPSMRFRGLRQLELV